MLTAAFEEDEDFDRVVVERVESVEELWKEEDDDDDDEEPAKYEFDEELTEDELDEEPDAEDDPLLADIASSYS